jgi:hypothetical protein
MTGEGYIPDMPVITESLETTAPDAVFGGVRVVVEQEVVVVVCRHGSHPHDLISAGGFVHRYTSGRDSVDVFADDELAGTKDSLVMVYPRVDDVTMLPPNCLAQTGVPL